jgi:hypothetical protein
MQSQMLDDKIRGMRVSKILFVLSAVFCTHFAHAQSSGEKGNNPTPHNQVLHCERTHLSLISDVYLCDDKNTYVVNSLSPTVSRVQVISLTGQVTLGAEEVTVLKDDGRVYSFALSGGKTITLQY